MALVLILGLRRSGTTAIWRAFRNLPGFTGFDEPFNPKLRQLPRDHHKSTLDDFFAVHDRDPTTLLDRFEPIEPTDEAADHLTNRQRRYLDWLVSQASAGHVVVDETRCGFKLEAISETVEPDLVIHLSREPAAWIRSHLVPSEQGLSYARQRLRSRLTRLRTRRMPRDYGLDRVVASAVFQVRLKGLGLCSNEFDMLPAAGKLYLLWVLHESEIARLGPALWGDRYRAVTHAQFVNAPADVLKESLATAQLSYPAAALHRACSHVSRNPEPRATARVSELLTSVISEGMPAPHPVVAGQHQRLFPGARTAND